MVVNFKYVKLSPVLYLYQIEYHVMSVGYYHFFYFIFFPIHV